MPQLYRGDEISPFIHSIDVPGWLQHGWVESPESANQVNLSPEHKETNPPSLALINEATTAEDIAVLPSIGVITAQLILDARPTTGYDSLEAVAKVDGTSRVQWDDVKVWEID